MRFGLLKYFTVVLGMLLSNVMSGQCPDFDGLIQKGDAYLTQKSPNYQEAINAYIAAIINCTHRASEAQQRISKMVNGINDLRAKAVISETKAKEALEAVKKAEEKAIIERNNAITSEQKSSKILSNIKFTDNRAWVFQDGKFAIIDSLGNRYCDFAYTQPRLFDSKGFTIATLNDNNVLLGRAGNVIFSQKTIQRTTNGFYLCNNGTHNFFLDASGKGISDTFSTIRPYYEGRAWVNHNGKWKILTNGFKTIEPEIEITREPESFYRGISFLAESSGKTLFSRDGSIFADSIVDYKFINDTIVQLRKKDQVAWKNLNGKFEVPFEYGESIGVISKNKENIFPIGDVLIWIKNKDRTKIIRRHNFKTIFDWNSNIYFENTFFLVKSENGYYGVYSNDGKEILSPKMGMSKPIDRIIFPYGFSSDISQIINLETGQKIIFDKLQKVRFVNDPNNLQLYIEDVTAKTIKIFDIKRFDYVLEVNNVQVSYLDNYGRGMEIFMQNMDSEYLEFYFCKNEKVFPIPFYMSNLRNFTYLSKKQYFLKIHEQWHFVDLNLDVENAIVDTFYHKPILQDFFYIGELNNGYKLFFKHLMKWENDDSLIVHKINQFYVDNDRKQVLIFDNKKWSLLNEKGEIIQDNFNGKVFPFQDSLSTIRIDGKTKVINRKSQMATGLACGYIEKVGNNTFKAQNEGKWGLLDGNGEIVLDFLYDTLVPEGLFVKIKKENKWGIFSMQGNRQLLEAIYEDVSFYQEDPTPTNVRLIGSANQRSAVFNGLGNKLFESTSLIVGGHNFIGLIKLENEKLRLYSIDNNILFNNEYNVLKLFRFKNRNYVVFDINSSVEGEKREFGWFELSNKKNIFTDTQFDDIVDIIPRKNYLEVIRDSKLIGDCFGLYSVDGDMLVAPYLGLYRGQPETRQCYNFEYTEYVIDEKYNRLIIDSLGNSPLPIVYSHKHDQCRDNLHIMGGGYNNWVNDNKGKFIIPPVKSASITVEGDILKVNFIENGYKLFTIEGEPIFPDTIKNIIGKISNKDSTWFVSNDSLVLIDLKNKTRKNFTYFPYKLEDELSDSLWIVTTKDNQLCLFNNRNSSGIIKCYENYKIDPYRWHYKDNETIVKNGWIVAVQSSNGGETGYWITSRGDLIYQYESNQKQPIYTGVNTNGEFIVE